jgi:hypothetical protein
VDQNKLNFLWFCATGERPYFQPFGMGGKSKKVSKLFLKKAIINRKEKMSGFYGL